MHDLIAQSLLAVFVTILYVYSLFFGERVCFGTFIKGSVYVYSQEYEFTMENHFDRSHRVCV